MRAPWQSEEARGVVEGWELREHQAEDGTIKGTYMPSEAGELIITFDNRQARLPLSY